ncbi:hypothetical protein [Corynebacterium camporealensis]
MFGLFGKKNKNSTTSPQQNGQQVPQQAAAPLQSGSLSFQLGNGG